MAWTNRMLNFPDPGLLVTSSRHFGSQLNITILGTDHSNGRRCCFLSGPSCTSTRRRSEVLCDMLDIPRTVWNSVEMFIVEDVNCHDVRGCNWRYDHVVSACGDRSTSGEISGALDRPVGSSGGSYCFSGMRLGRLGLASTRKITQLVSNVGFLL